MITTHRIGGGTASDEPDSRTSRRSWLIAAGLAGAASALSPRFSLAGQEKAEKEEEEEIAPTEDLMREHGVLNRILLVYEEAIHRIESKHELPLAAVHDAAILVRSFVEDYHEKLEEDYLFPRFESARRLADLTKVLREQHKAGRALTEQVMQLASLPSVKEASRAATLAGTLRQFIRMYRPHEAREDTELFPALRSVVSKQEFDALGEDFEKKEHQLFGEDGFERIVERVSSIEKTLGIYDLAQFTPRV